MAKGKYDEWLEPENLVLIHGWKMQGLTDEQIADNISKHLQVHPRHAGLKERSSLWPVLR